MTPTEMHDRRPAADPERAERPDSPSLFAAGMRPLLALVISVAVLGSLVLVSALVEVAHTRPSVYVVILGALVVASGRFAIKVPGRPATVSVSEVFLFASVLLFGPAWATLIVAVDGTWVSLRQKRRRLYRAIFNVTEPAISTWVASHAFFALTGIPPTSISPRDTPALIGATVAMAAVFFVLNSTLTAAAIGWENRVPPREVWSRHALYLAINYYAAASLAALAVTSSSGLSIAVVGLLAPLLILSYVAYREASTRVDEAQRHVGEIRHLYQATVEMLALAVEGKDQGTHGHVRRVQRNARAVAQALGIVDETELKAIEAGSLLHDIGKLGVPDYILNKPGALTRAEFDAMKRHATMGARILTAVDFPYPVVPIVRHHHERWDGHGYPDGLLRTEIPLGARILSVIDCFDALTSDRPYRPKLSDERAAEILRERSGTFYDPAVVEKFIQLIPTLRPDVDLAEERAAGLGSVVASMTRNAAPAVRLADGETAPPPALPVGESVSALIDSHVARLPGAEACLFLLDASGDHLVVAHATAGLREDVGGLEMEVGRGLSGWVLANRSTIRNADPMLDFDHLAERFGLRSCTSTPVFADGDLVGALSVYLSRPGGFSEREARAVGRLGQQVGLGISAAEDDRGERRLSLALRSARHVAAAS